MNIGMNIFLKYAKEGRAWILLIEKKIYLVTFVFEKSIFKFFYMKIKKIFSMFNILLTLDNEWHKNLNQIKFITIFIYWR